MEQQIDFKDVTLRLDVSSRGGGIEIDLTPFGFEGEKMTAYQNYLGGGMLGRVLSQDTIRAFKKPFITEEQAKKLDEIAENLKKYFHELSNHSDDEWENQTYEENQKMPISGY